MHPAGEPGYTKTTYEEDFVFTTAAGRRIEGKTNLTPDSWDRINPGDTFRSPMRPANRVPTKLAQTRAQPSVTVLSSRYW